MMLSFEEKIVGIYLQRKQVTIVEVRAPFTLGHSGFKIKNICTVETHDIESMIPKLSTKTPIIVVSQFPVQLTEKTEIHRDSENTETIFSSLSSISERAIKPLITLPGSLWQSKSNEFFADGGETSEFLNILAKHGFQTTAVTSISDVLLNVVFNRTEQAHLVITGQDNRFTILAIGAGKVLASRTLQCPMSQLSAEIKQWIIETQKQHSQWVPQHFFWPGNDCPNELIDQLTESYSRYQMQPLTTKPLLAASSASEFIASAAAVYWLSAPQPTCLRQLAGNSVQLIQTIRKSNLILHLFICFFLMILAAGTWQIKINTTSVFNRLSHNQSSHQKTSPRGLPGSHYPVIHPEQLRPHKHLTALAAMTKSGTTIETLHLSPAGIELTGSGQTIDAVNRFYQTVSTHFKDLNATVQTPETTRNDLGRLSFRISIILGKASS